MCRANGGELSQNMVCCGWPLPSSRPQQPTPHFPVPRSPLCQPTTAPRSRVCVCVPVSGLVPSLQSAAKTEESVGALATAGAGSAGGGASASASSTHAPYPEPDPLTCCALDCGAEFDTKGRQPVAAACVCGTGAARGGRLPGGRGCAGDGASRGTCDRQVRIVCTCAYGSHEWEGAGVVHSCCGLRLE